MKAVLEVEKGEEKMFDVEVYKLTFEHYVVADDGKKSPH